MMSEQLKFIAAILSIFTHELNNHSSIMNESAGLVLDLIEIKKDSNDRDLEQISSVTGGITGQVKKTTALVKYLNRFAHRLDAPLSNYNIYEVIEELVKLIERMLNQKEITVEMDFADDGIIIFGNPSILQYIIFSIIKDYLKCLKNGDDIIINVLKGDSAIEIKFQADGEKKIIINENMDCLEAVKQIGASIAGVNDGLVITLPLIVNGN
jgi:C4-dicarboxylate-specific signal transduction histidine kinase